MAGQVRDGSKSAGNFHQMKGFNIVMKRAILGSCARKPLLCLVAVLLKISVGCHGMHEPVKSAQRLDSNEDVQPILARDCFSCHGHPDAIVPGHPEQSELIKKIESSDPHYLMPQSHRAKRSP
jgi:hypothetical protein